MCGFAHFLIDSSTNPSWLRVETGIPLYGALASDPALIAKQDRLGYICRPRFAVDVFNLRRRILPQENMGW
jgi:hypothetical protein